MSNFNSAILTVLRNEGGFSNDKADKGGATNHGISTRFLKQIDKDIDGDGHVTSKDAKSITKETAIELYKKYFWDHYNLEKIRDINVATKAFDLFVNMRGKSAGKILQKACNSFCEDGSLNKKLIVDGIAGSKTMLAINSIAMFTVNKSLLLKAIKHEQSAFYHAIVKSNKTQAKFLKGWLARAAR